jgi:PhnB protein
MSASLAPYLNFDGNSREVMQSYQRILGGELEVSTFAEFGAQVSDGHKDKVMHSRLDADGMVIMASDAQEGHTPVTGDNVSLSLDGGPADAARLSAVFHGLAEGGTTLVPLAESPWGATFGMLIDKFGIQWLVNIRKE